MPRPSIVLFILAAFATGVLPFLFQATASKSGDSLIPIGVARTEITPDGPIRLSGYGGRSEETEDVEQKLWAKALAIGADGDSPSLLITVDLIGVPAWLTDGLAERLSKGTGVDRSRLAVCATHTHTGPSVRGVLPFMFSGEISEPEEKRIAAYSERLAEKLHALALEALKNRRPGRLSWAQGKAGFAQNRRAIVDGKWTGFGGNPDGPVDHALPVLKVTGDDGSTRAIFVSYACHCTTRGGKSNRLHGDWAGSAAAAMERDHPGAIAMVAAGCGADQNPALRGDGSEADRNGAEIANEVKRLLSGKLREIAAAPRGEFRRIALAFDRVVTREELEERVVSGRAQAQYHAGVMLERLDRGIEPPATMPYALQTWIFGDELAMVFLPGEVVVDYALRLKRELDSDRLWVNAYANDLPSYIASKRIIPEGGYEVDASMDYYGNPVRFAMDVEERIIGAVREMVPLAFEATPDLAAKTDPDRLPQPKSPEEALASISVRPGLAAELMAAEPLVMDPIDIAWGPDGKMWVVEMADYPLGIDGEGAPGGRVRFLEDTDGDGRYDTSILFADGLNFPTGVMPWREGVLVTAAPEILYLEDTDGDGKSDARRVLYEGFVEGNQQHRVNGLRWGLDNWIHIANGDSGGEIRSTKTGEAVDINGRDLRIRPDAGLAEAQTGRAQYGRNRDDWGNWFGCSNSNPMWHYVLEDHYLRRNPHIAAPGTNNHLQGRAAPVYPVSETLARFNNPESVNQFTSACGAMIYRDILLGDSLYGNSFVAEPVHNLVHREVLTPEGVTFTSRRTEDESESEFFASTDTWCRPVAVRTGPDGALWIVDMYRLVIEHPQWIPDDWEARLNLRAGEDRGRIYRIIPRGAVPRAVPRLDDLDAAGLVAALDSPNGWQRDMAHQMLLWKGGKEAVELLEPMATTGDRALSRLHALCVLDGLDALDAAVLVEALGDASSGVRRHAARLSERFADSSSAVGEALCKLADDPDPGVRLQAACSLGERKGDRAAGVALGRIAASAEDSYVRAAVMSSALPHMDALVEAALQRGGDAPAKRQLARSLMGLAAAMKKEDMIARLLASITDESRGRTEQFAALAEALDGLADRQMNLKKLRDRAGDDLKPVLGEADRLVDEARRIAGDEDAPVADRAAAAGLPGRGMGRQAEDVKLLAGLLSPRMAPGLQMAAVKSLGRLGRAEIPELLLEDWAAHSPAVRSAVIDLILGRAAWLTVFLDAAEEDPELLAALDASRRQTLLQNPARAVRDRARELFGESVVSNREKVVDQFRPALALNGDPESGKALFESACAVCHQLDGVGRAIGPDLAALTDKSNEALLVAIIDPNRAKEDKFSQYVAVTKDGRTIVGMVVEEAGNSITLIGIDGTPQTVLRHDLISFTSTGLSLMPDGLEAAFTPQQIADLLAYLRLR